MQRLHILIFALAAILVCAPLSLLAGTAYIWTDENGVKRFSDTPPEGVSGVVEVNIKDAEEPPAPAPEFDETETGAEGEEGQEAESQPRQEDSETAKKKTEPQIDPNVQRQIWQGQIDTLHQTADRYEAEIEAAQQRLDQEAGRNIDSDQSRKQIEYWQERVDSAQQGLETTNKQISNLETQIHSLP